MPSNPMQRKVRNSFLLGMIITLVVAILLGAILFILIVKPILDKQSKEVEKVFVYRLKKGVESGKDVTSSMVESVEIPKEPNSGYFIASNRDAKGNPVSPVAFPSGWKAKIDLKAGTVLTKSMLYQQEIDPSLRYVEYNMITMPTVLQEGDFVDVRLRLSNRQDLIVISQKEVISVYGQTVGLNLTEDEIVIMNSAIVDAYIMTASELYFSIYVSGVEQEAATYTYMPSIEVIDLINSNSNIIGEARKKLAEIYGTKELQDERTIIDELESKVDKKDQNIETGIKKQIENAKKARLNYLSDMGSY